MVGCACFVGEIVCTGLDVIGSSHSLKQDQNCRKTYMMIMDCYFEVYKASCENRIDGFHIFLEYFVGIMDRREKKKVNRSLK